MYDPVVNNLIDASILFITTSIAGAITLHIIKKNKYEKKLKQQSETKPQKYINSDAPTYRSAYPGTKRRIA